MFGKAIVERNAEHLADLAMVTVVLRLVDPVIALGRTPATADR
jgi:hypothetical protein